MQRSQKNIYLNSESHDKLLPSSILLENKGGNSSGISKLKWKMLPRPKQVKLGSKQLQMFNQVYVVDLTCICLFYTPDWPSLSCYLPLNCSVLASLLDKYLAVFLLRLLVSWLKQGLFFNPRQKKSNNDTKFSANYLG